MTGSMVAAVEKILIKETPDMLLVYGDTNSTLAGALAAVKLHIPVCHIEAGNRAGSLTNPEEVNRICTDHVSSLLLCCTESAVENLSNEGLTKNVSFVGDPMYDAFLYYGKQLTQKDRTEIYELDGRKVTIPQIYYYMTCHREENTKTEEVLIEILKAMNSLDAVTVYPVHPRNQVQVLNIQKKWNFKNIFFVKPVGYLTSISLIKSAKKIVTDSGDLQREAFFAGVDCVTVLDFAWWPETMRGNQNQIVHPIKEDILRKLSSQVTREKDYLPFGNGSSANKIVNAMKNYWNS
jgi:UDP-N-acetylglucosamine 2-epimerase (non-hydrolysing)/UDP-GlcNAc3NAcA epimerase